jgi:hypothetical protein
VHIRRKLGFGEPVEKGRSDQAERPFHFRADKTNKYRDNSQNPHDNRYAVGYKTGMGNDFFGEMIDYVYRFLTDIEENKYKMGEINKIVDRHNSSMTQKWIPWMNYDRLAVANAFQTWIADTMKNDHSSELRDSEANVAASSNQEIKETSHDLFPIDGEGNAQQSSSSVHPVSSGNGESVEDEWVEDDGWMVKYDMYGNVVDAHKHYKDP